MYSFIKNDRKLGNYQNPFDFRRYWDVPKTQLSASTNSQVGPDTTIQDQLDQLQRTLIEVLQNQHVQKAKGKGKGKRSSAPDIGSSILSTLGFRSRPSNESQEIQPENTSSASSQVGDPTPSTSSQTGDPPPSYSDIVGPNLTATKRIFVRKVELHLNGSPLGKMHIFITYRWHH